MQCYCRYMAIWPSGSWRYYHVFRQCRWAYIARSCCTVALTQRWVHIEFQWVQLFYWRDWFSWLCYIARKIGAGWTHYWRNLRLKITVPGNRAKLIPRTIPSIPAVCRAFCWHSCTAQQSLKNRRTRDVPPAYTKAAQRASETKG